MILKFKTTGQPDNHYQFIDEVNNLMVAKGPRTDFCTKKNVDCWWEDSSVMTDDSMYIQLEWTGKDGTFKSYISHLPVYLLNDAGKTIERLL